MTRKRSDLNDEQKHVLEDLYRTTPLSVDDLPYTEDMERIHCEFQRRTNRNDSIKDVLHLLKNMGRDGRLGGKLRPKATSEDKG